MVKDFSAYTDQTNTGLWLNISPKPATEHDPESVPSTSHPHSPSLQHPSSCCKHIYFPSPSTWLLSKRVPQNTYFYHHHIKTGCGAHPAPIQFVPGAPSSRITRSDSKADSSSASNGEINERRMKWMRHVAAHMGETRLMLQICWWESLKKRCHYEDLRMEGRIILKCI